MSSSSPSYTYPHATSPDIIRSHQKDAYFSAHLHELLNSLLRKTHGARTAHTYTSETRVFSELLYLGLTTLLGNRTLGEEYCDIVQVEGESGRLPALGRRAGYIICCVLAPYGLTRILPAFRRRIRAKLEASLRWHARQRAKGNEKDTGSKTASPSLAARFQAYILLNLDTITSPAPLYAVSLATFYFSGSYYHLSKRLWSLRYIFTRTVPDSDQRVGYEVLGVLLVLQMAVQAYLHMQNTFTSETSARIETHAPGQGIGTAAIVGPGIEVSLDPSSYASNNALLFEASAPVAHPTSLAKWTHTPMLSRPRYDLEDPGTMAWIPEGQQRKCTLCLEEMKDPSVTTCGHVFCWGCIADWVREKPECPLCRQSVLLQHILVLRG